MVGVSFVGRFTEPEGVVQPRQKYGDYSRDESRQQGVESVAISGPVRASDSVADTPSRREILVCRPTRGTDEEPCAKRILSRLARRAYRRRVSDAEVQALLGFYRTGRRDGDFHAGIQFGVERIPDPAFCSRVNAIRTDRAEYRLRIGDLGPPACRSCGAVFRTTNSRPAVRETQDPAGHRRCTAAGRCPVERAVDNFVGQWLLFEYPQRAPSRPVPGFRRRIARVLPVGTDPFAAVSCTRIEASSCWRDTRFQLGA